MASTALLWAGDEVGGGDPVHGAGYSASTQDLDPKGDADDGQDVEGGSAEPAPYVVKVNVHGGFILISIVMGRNSLISESFRAR